jgi:hypothetical protein
MARNTWMALKPWKPFFWDPWLPTGVYLRSTRRPALLPSGHEVDEQIYFAVRLAANVQVNVLRFAGYAFLIDPGTHTSRSVRREGYWYYPMGEASSASGAINLLKHLMDFFEGLASYGNREPDYSEATLARIIAWDERVALAACTHHTRLQEFRSR